MRLLSIAAVGLFCLSVFNPASASADATGPGGTAEPVARFERDKPAKANLSLRREGAGWRVALRAGGVPNGAATAADCELQAVGPQDADDVIIAHVAPFEGDLNTISAADIGAVAPVLQVRVGPEGVFVEDGGAAARFCGMGSDVNGFYRRLDTPE
ncbi:MULTISPECIES: hypothetical protein [unclassified Brevundimonas]|uniref:hypothetical protein n=1 Tax=unclassified Brevundimonas TaxID=2622653 RepID=UPI0025C26655|nr:MULTISPECIES: hypothetical protein [unclassified Brevundimonas]